MGDRSWISVPSVANFGSRRCDKSAAATPSPKATRMATVETSGICEQMPKRGRLSQGQSRKEAERRRLADTPAKNFLRGRCDETIQRFTVRDVRLLARLIPFKRLATTHPIFRVWTTPTSMARFQIHHLADDLRLIEGVEGSRGLIKRLVEDPDAYEDYRYEIRMAASLTRHGNQRLVRLAGNNVGADIEFESVSGHRCGVACYRTSATIPAVGDASTACARIADAFLQEFAENPFPMDIGLEVEFPSFPATEAMVLEAPSLLVELWRDFHEPRKHGVTGVRVERIKPLSEAVSRDCLRRARIRFMFPNQEWEKERARRHVLEKLDKESRQWAANFEGKRFMFVEESRLSRGLNADDLKSLVAESGDAFSGMITSQLMYDMQPGGRAHAIEVIGRFVRDSEVRLHIETLGNNTAAMSHEVPLVRFASLHASEVWDLWQATDGSCTGRAVKPLEMSVGMASVPRQDSTRPIGSDDEFWQRFQEAVGTLRAQQGEIFDS